MFVAAAVSDARSYRIPNLACLGIGALFPLFAFTSPAELQWGQHIAMFCLVLAAGFVVFARKIAGAGDIKLLAVASLWAGPDLLGIFLFITAIAGGLLSLMLAAAHYWQNRKANPEEAVNIRKIPVPYGVAIAIGGLCVLLNFASKALSQPTGVN